MNFKYGLFNSYFKHYKHKENMVTFSKNLGLSLCKGEKFAFQILISCDEDFCCKLGNSMDISYKGLINSLRFSVKDNSYLKNIKLSFLGYVEDDNKNLLSDPILNNKTLLINKNEYQSIWVEGFVPNDSNISNTTLEIDIYESKDYLKEKILSSIKVNIEILNISIPKISESDFFLDLWQHPSNWARMYDVEYFSDDHWFIIENNLKELASSGAKVITLIVSDYSWAGQGCYKEFKNPSNLFELNIVNVYKGNDNHIYCDFTNLDKYLKLCFKYGIDAEIDIFGIIGNWDNFSFGNPLKDYKDPIRISYYDENEKAYSYIDCKDDLKEYLTQLFNHLYKLNIFDKVRIISDEPNNSDLFKEWVNFIDKCALNKNIKFKCAIHNQEFYEKFNENIQDISLNTYEIINNITSIKDLGDKLSSKNGKATWYSCCFPKKLNTFLESPLLESRLIPWFTYYINFHGFLRWAYAIWPSNPFKEVSYKYPNWTAGDMFFVYPGKNMKPISSVRWENLKFGIQDYMILKIMEQKGLNSDYIRNQLGSLLGNKEDMKCLENRQIDFNYSLDGENYINLRNNLIKSLNKL
ncbi:DUF4091 domain-containing protein [Clostridium fallax]|uniref:Glycoside hydrolase 123 catalytic domain-containing protein n=1 Tax=Clostridium fallax TaxID=1533 RepID=A0A1M4T4T6_9CLOT|nr:DUF4091 domain-containing protein [Clostridium fallax]SHE39440.1 protein of unknown function [Clostridium fallax]SQB22596.1 Uncharacterised protein [Clostridium fallax]